MHDPLKLIMLVALKLNIPTQSLQPWDIVGFRGNKMLEVYTKDRTRYYENWGARDILKEYFLEVQNGYLRSFRIE